MPDSDTLLGDWDYVWAALRQPRLSRGSTASTTTFAFLSFLKAALRSQNRSTDTPKLLFANALVGLSLCPLTAQDHVCLLKQEM
jgi:hypothetical protein